MIISIMRKKFDIIGYYFVCCVILGHKNGQKIKAHSLVDFQYLYYFNHFKWIYLFRLRPPKLNQIHFKWHWFNSKSWNNWSAVLTPTSDLWVCCWKSRQDWARCQNYPHLLLYHMRKCVLPSCDHLTAQQNFSNQPHNILNTDPVLCKTSLDDAKTNCISSSDKRERRNLSVIQKISLVNHFFWTRLMTLKQFANCTLCEDGCLHQIWLVCC